MDLVHMLDRGSMDPVHESGPPLVHVLSSPFLKSVCVRRIKLRWTLRCFEDGNFT